MNTKNPQRLDSDGLDALYKRLSDLQRQYDVSINAGQNPNYRTKLASDIEAAKAAIEALEK